MSQTKIPRCNRCFHEVSWDKTARERLSTTRPVTPDKQFIHECPKDGNDVVLVAVGFEQQAKEAYDKYIASKEGNTAAATAATPLPPTVINQNQQPTSAQEGQAAVSAALNSQNLDQTMKIAFAELIRQNQEFMQEYEGRFQRMENQINTLIQQGAALAKTVEDYVTYNPAAYSLTAIFHKLLPLVDMDKLKEQTALEKLESMKEDPTLEGKNLV